LMLAAVLADVEGSEMESEGLRQRKQVRERAIVGEIGAMAGAQAALNEPEFLQEFVAADVGGRIRGGTGGARSNALQRVAVRERRGQPRLYESELEGIWLAGVARLLEWM